MMADIVLQATDLGTATLKPKPGPASFSLKRAMPDGKWTAPDNPPKPFEGRPTDGASHIDLIQAWAEYKVDLRLNFLDALVRAVEGVFTSFGTLMGGDIGGGIRSAAQQLRDLIGDDYRDLFITWECKFESDADATVLVAHLHDYNVSITRTTNFTPPAPTPSGAPAAPAPAAGAAAPPAASRMAWLIDTRLRIGTTMLDGARVSVAGRATSSNTASKADIVFVQKGEHTIESISHIRLDCEGFAKDLGKLFDDLMTAITEGLEIEKLVAEHMIQWIKDHTSAVFGGPSTGDTLTEQDRYRKEQMDRIKAKVKSLVNLLQTQLLNLLQEYKGFVALDKSLIGLTCLSEAGVKRIGAVLLEAAKKDKDKHADNRLHTREQLLRSDHQPMVAGRSLFGPEEWAVMGLDPTAYAFSVVSTERLEARVAIADLPVTVASDHIRFDDMTFAIAPAPTDAGPTSGIGAPRTNIRPATNEERLDSVRAMEIRREERRAFFASSLETTSPETPPAENPGSHNPI
jgi:hypothetical protein